MLKSLFVFLLAFSSCAFAEEQNTQEKIVDALSKGKDQVVQALSHSRLVRQNSNYFATGNFAPVDLILPSKFGLTLGTVTNADYTWELEYLKSSVSVPFLVDDIGEMTDERLSVIRRNYFGTETFNLSYGLSYNRFKVHIGSKYLAYIATNVPDVDLMQIDSLGFNVGIGNRWIFSNRWMLGVDWVSWSQPVFTTKYNNKYSDYATDEDSKDTIDTVAKLIRWVPRITLLKLQVGYSF